MFIFSSAVLFGKFGIPAQFLLILLFLVLCYWEEQSRSRGARPEVRSCPTRRGWREVGRRRGGKFYGKEGPGSVTHGHGGEKEQGGRKGWGQKGDTLRQGEGDRDGEVGENDEQRKGCCWATTLTLQTIFSLSWSMCERAHMLFESLSELCFVIEGLRQQEPQTSPSVAPQRNLSTLISSTVNTLKTLCSDDWPKCEWKGSPMLRLSDCCFL